MEGLLLLSPSPAPCRPLHDDVHTHTHTHIQSSCASAHGDPEGFFFSFSGRDLEELKISPPLAASHFCWGGGGEVNNFAQRNVKKWETKSTKDEFTRGIAQRHQRYVTHTQRKTKLAKQKKEEFKSFLYNKFSQNFFVFIL
jgi:hypothetical protein